MGALGARPRGHWGEKRAATGAFSRAGNEPSRSLKFYDQADCPFAVASRLHVNQKAQKGVLMRAFSMIVKLQTSRRLVSISSVLCSAIGRVALRSAAANSELRGVRRQERANKMPEILINSLCLSSKEGPQLPSPHLAQASVIDGSLETRKILQVLKFFNGDKIILYQIFNH